MFAEAKVEEGTGSSVLGEDGKGDEVWHLERAGVGACGVGMGGQGKMSGIGEVVEKGEPG
jgi:hypothetical protein